MRAYILAGVSAVGILAATAALTSPASAGGFCGSRYYYGGGGYAPRSYGYTYYRWYAGPSYYYGGAYYAPRVAGWRWRESRWGWRSNWRWQRDWRRDWAWRRW